MKSKLLLILSLVAGTMPFSFSTAGAQTTSLTQDLAACWDLNESSGTRADFWNSNDLTDFNTVTANPGHVNTQAAQFVRVNSEYLQAADDTTLHLTSDFTIMAWVYIDTASLHHQLLVNQGTEPYFDFRVNSSDNLQAWMVDSGTTTCNGPTATLSPGQWYLGLFWADYTAGYCYISLDNGSPTSTSNPRAAPNNTNGLLLGGTTQDLDGRLGPVAIWTRALAAADRDWLWNGGSGRNCTQITGLTADRAYSQDVIDLPNGRRGAVEMRLSAGEIAISTGVLGLLILAIFWIMRDTVRSSKVGDK